jgi:hypothetical protein
MSRVLNAWLTALIAFAAALAPGFAIAAEWSMTPTVSSSVDAETNRSLNSIGGGSQSTALSCSAQFQRATDVTQLTLAPHASWQRIAGAIDGNVTDEGLSAGFSWAHERSKFSASMSAADDSTLSSELTETGILNTNTDRRTAQASASESVALSEHRSLIFQASYVDASYHGPNAAVLTLLQGYRYPSGSVGESFVLSERSTVSVTAFTGKLLTRIRENDSQQSGAQVEVSHPISETTGFSASVGATVQSYGGARQTSEIASLNLSHSWEKGGIALAYSRGLEPLGIGVLAQRQQLTLSLSRVWTSRLSSQLAVLWTREDTLLSGNQQRSYGSFTGSLVWQAAETISVRGDIGESQAFGSVAGTPSGKNWRTSLTLTWAPHAQVRTY